MKKSRLPSSEIPTTAPLDAELLAENLRLQRKIIKHEVKIASLENKIIALHEEIEDVKKTALQRAMGELFQRANSIKPASGSNAS